MLILSVRRGIPSQCGPTESGGDYDERIANVDQTVVARDPGGLRVKMVAACVGDLGVDLPHPRPVPGAARPGERGFIIAIVAQRRDLGPVAQRRDRNAPTLFLMVG